ncbi:hypothetical protein EC991_010231 [Linnemannia zychae]|nr:hypothetical protein EC991_010231 [Linnemannia zychae]
MLHKTQPNSPACGVTGDTENQESSGRRILKDSAREEQTHQHDVELDASAGHKGELYLSVMTTVDPKADYSTSHDHHDHHDHYDQNRDHDQNTSNGSIRQQTTGSEYNDIEGNKDDAALKRRIERLSTSDRGRIMVARSQIPKGTFLYRISPQAIVCDSENRTRRCGGCLKRLGSKSLKEEGVNKETVGAGGEAGKSGRCADGWGCKGCGEIWYCDQACAEWDWRSLHAAECRFLRALYQGNPDNNNNNSQDVDKDEEAWVSTVGTPYREAISRFSQSFSPYTQDYSRVLIRVLTHRFHELTDPSVSQHGTHSDDPPYLASPDITKGPGPLLFAEVEDLVANQSSFARDMIEGEFRDVMQVLDAFQAHLEVFYLPRQFQQRRDRQQGQGAGTVPVPRRLSQTELLDLIMREECNSFGHYEYPPLPPSIHSTKTATPSVDATLLEVDNSKQGYALGLHIRHHVYGFNHSCSPNLFHVAHNHQLLLYAGRDILPGEEINITYLEFGPYYRLPPPPLGAPARAEVAGMTSTVDEEEVDMAKKRKEAFETRTRFLKSHFHFDCGCARCNYEHALYSSSNNNNNNINNNSSSATGKKINEVLSEEEDRFLREGLSCERGGCYGFYAPPAVIRARQDDTTINSNGDKRWKCVACGYCQL